MTKILITSKNSPNGIVQKIIGSNVYENILSFDNQTLKDEFINKYYFNDGEDYKTLIQNKTDKPFKVVSDLLANIRIDTQEYPNESRISLLNKDTAVILEDGNYYWYALKNPTYESNNTISYEAELDIFLTYDIKDIETQGEVPIIKSHTDRIDKYLNHIVDNNILFENDLAFSNPSQETLKEIKHEVYNDFPHAKEVVWGIIYSRLSEGEEGCIISYDRNPNGEHEAQSLYRVNQRLPYKIYVFPFQIGDDLTSYYIKSTYDGSIKKDWGHSTYNHFRDKTTTISIHFTKNIPINFSRIESLDGNPGKIDEYHIANIDVPNDPYTNDYSWYESGKALEIKDFSIFKRDSYVSIPLDENYSITSYNEFRNINNEVKLNYSQFKKIKIMSYDTENEFEYQREYINHSNISLHNTTGYQSTILTQIISINNYTLKNAKFNKMGLVKTTNIEFPLNTSAYNDYESQHRLSSKRGYLGGVGKNVIGGAASGAIGGGVVGGPIGAAIGAGVGAGSGVVKSVFSGIDHAVEMSDIKHTPDTPRNNTNSFGLLYEADKDPYIQILELPQYYKEICYNHLYIEGYTVRTLGKLSDWIKTRYYFNYIQTASIFNNITAQLSPAIKQIISDTLTSGVRIWHVRDLETYKGLLNYEYENQEMSLITTSEKDNNGKQKNK